MIGLTHLRTVAIALSTFTFACGLVTQLLARALAYAPQLGPPLLDLDGLHIYAPFSFLRWSIAWAPVAPSLLALSLCLTLICALAAYAVAIVVAGLDPITLQGASPWRGLAGWREIGDYGLLRDDGLALGAINRHAMARPRLLRSSADAVLFLGQPKHVDEPVQAALASWPGTVVLVDARGALAAKLGREEVLRFAPGRSDTVCFNPLFAIRGGLEAWGDARRLASALLPDLSAPPDQPGIDVFALLMLDQLLTAPLEARTLAALRRRLLNPAALIAELCGRWAAEPPAGAEAVLWEMTRAARAMRAEPAAALLSLARIDQALAPFAGAALAHATGAHQLNLAHVLSAPAPQTLVLSLQQDDADAAPLVRALLAQLAALRASGGAELLLAIEADAARRLAAQANAALPSSAHTRLLIQAVDVAEAERLVGANADRAAIVAIGPQTQASAEIISRRAGACAVFAMMPHRLPRWCALLFPTWRRQQTARLPAEALQAAAPDQALLVAPDQKPVRLRALTGAGASAFAGAQALAPHDWTAPPAVQTMPAPGEVDTPLASPAPSAAKLRRMLSRTSAKPTGKTAP